MKGVGKRGVKIRIGHVVEVRFYDHCLSRHDLANITAFGEVVQITPLKLTLRFWKADFDNDVNDEVFTILRSAIVDLRILFEPPHARVPGH